MSYLEKIPKNILDDYNQQRHPEFREYICHAPFKSIFFSVDGTVCTCCFNFENIFGKYPSDQTLLEMWRGKEATQLRDMLRKDILPKGCDMCKKSLFLGNYSAMNSIFYDMHQQKQIEWPTNMLFELSNKCNLECIMCSSSKSSAIASKQKDAKLESPYTASFVKELEPFIPYLKQATFSGGEPFIIDIYYDIWDIIIKKNPGCVIAIQTNGTVYNEKVARLLERGNISINISLDGITQETYEKIRVNASYKQVMSNIEKFYVHCLEKQTQFMITPSPLRANWQELSLIVEFCNQINVAVCIKRVVSPESLALFSLSKAEREVISGKLLAYNFDVPKSPIAEENIGLYKMFAKEVANFQ